jgi:hypothetical protein
MGKPAWFPCIRLPCDLCGTTLGIGKSYFRSRNISSCRTEAHLWLEARSDRPSINCVRASLILGGHRVCMTFATRWLHGSWNVGRPGAKALLIAFSFYPGSWDIATWKTPAFVISVRLRPAVARSLWRSLSLKRYSGTPSYQGSGEVLLHNYHLCIINSFDRTGTSSQGRGTRRCKG